MGSPATGRIILAQASDGTATGDTWIAGGGGEITYVQEKTGTETGSATTITTASGTFTSGNLLVAVVSWVFSPTISSISQSSGSNTWVAATSKYASSLDAAQIWYTYNATGFTGTITANFSGSVTYRNIIVYEFSGFGTSDPADAANGGNSDWANVSQTANITTYAGNALVIGVSVAYTAAITLSNPLIGESAVDGSTEVGAGAINHLMSYYRILTGTMTGHAQATLSGYNYHVAAVASFKVV